MMKSNCSNYIDHLLELVAFVKRPAIYIGKEDMDLILAFIWGFMASAKFELSIINDLTEYIFDKYQKNKELQKLKQNLNYYTLKDQIQLLAKQNESTIGQIFKKEGLSFLVEISDKKLNGAYKKKLVEKLERALTKNIESKDKQFTKTFSISPEDQIYKQLKEWPGISFNQKEMKILESIIEENCNRNLKWIKQEEGIIDDKTKLRQLSKELLNEITRDNKVESDHTAGV